jgi:hypothetical protein
VLSLLNSSADAAGAHLTPMAPPPNVGAPGRPERLQALFADTPEVAGSPAPLSRLQTSHRAWLRSLHMAGDRNVRVAFRLRFISSQSLALIMPTDQQRQEGIEGGPDAKPADDPGDRAN